MLNILSVEDDPGDRELLQYAFERAGTQARLEFAHDGEAAVSRLSRPARPDLVLLDLKLPRKSGFEVLEWLRSRPELKDLPVIVMTSSAEPRDIERAYALGANSYLVKSIEIDALTDVARSIAAFGGLVSGRKPESAG